MTVRSRLKKVMSARTKARKAKPRKPDSRGHHFLEVMHTKSTERTKCYHCGRWFNQSNLAWHLNSIEIESAKAKEPPDKPAAKPKPKTPTQSRKKKPVNKKNGSDAMPTDKPPPDGHNNPADGVADELMQLMSQWAGRMPATFMVAGLEAEHMGEAWRSVADSFRRRADNMVEELHIAPDCVEAFHEAAGVASKIADCHMEVANRIAARYEREIKYVNDPNAPHPDFLKEDR